MRMAEPRASACCLAFCKRFFQDFDGGQRRRTMNLATVDRAISMADFGSSPWILGAPHNGLTKLNSRVRS